MAFATSNIARTAFGNLKVTYGDWTGSVADASGSIVVEGGRVYFVEFNANDSTPTQVVPATWTAPTGTTATTTISVHNRKAVTAGTFIIIHS